MTSRFRFHLAITLILLLGWGYWTFLSTHTQPAYPRVKFWIESAECTRVTGHYLVACDPVKGEVPIEDVSLADDRGHALALSTLARIFGIEPSETVLRTLNLSLNALGFLLLALILLRKVGWRSALFTAVVGAYWLGARAGPDVDAAYIGIAAMTASALILAVSSTTRRSLFAILLLTSATALVREPIGLGAALSLILVALALPTTLGNSRASLMRSTVLFAIAFLTLRAPALPSLVRDAVLKTHATGTAAHGLSHNLFLGLGGFVENKWGIYWDDAYAQKVMHDLYPDVEYCSDAYFKLIGDLYWSYVKADPGEALRVYLVKTGRTLSAAEGLSWSALISMILLIGLITWAARTKMIPTNDRLLIAVGPLLFAFSFIGQGILTHPAWTYIYPGPIMLMVTVAIVFDQTRLRSTAPSS